MKNFKRGLFLGFGLLLTGCAELCDTRTSHVTTYEELNMELDSTTRNEAICILESYGYSVKTNVPKFSKKGKKLPKSTLNFFGGVLEKLGTLEVQVPKNNEWMKFFFDKDQKLIGFLAQGNRKILDPLIANDNENREVLISLSSDSLTKANRQRAGNLLSRYVRSQVINKKKSKKSSNKKKNNWDATIYLGKDLSFASNIHTDEYKDFTFYSVTSPGAVYQTIITIRDFVTAEINKVKERTKKQKGKLGTIKAKKTKAKGKTKKKK